MTLTWNNRKLASVMYLAGAEGDGTLWAVSKTMKYIPAPEWTGRHISAYSKSRFKYHWPSRPLLSACSDPNAEAFEWSFDSTVEFYWNLFYYLFSCGLSQHIHQHWYFPCEKWEWERKVNPCINSDPLLGVWKAVLENPNFCNHIYFILEYVIFCKICSAKWSARDERKSLGEKKQCKVKQEPHKEKKCLNPGMFQFFHQRGKAQINALYRNMHILMLYGVWVQRFTRYTYWSLHPVQMQWQQ